MKRDRDYEHEIERRELALRLVETLGNTPAARRQVARAMGVTERTLRRWANRKRAGEPLLKRPGRPPKDVPRARREGLIRAMLRLGPCAGVPALRGLFTDVPYRTIGQLKQRFVRAMRRRRGWHMKRLRWLRAGAVWATDFTHPRARLPGRNRRLHLVRDLGSGSQLAAVPCRGERANVACTVLAALFLILGPPLVLKHDGGSAFRAHETQDLLLAHGVVALCSPPKTPQYNGSCERSGGTLKERVAHAATIAGHPDTWTDAAIAEALLLANTTARPRGATGPTPAEALESRRPISRRERDAFKQTRQHMIERALETHETEHGRMATCLERAAIERKATQDALCKHGYLQIRRGRLSTPLSAWRAGIKA
jgi:transposase InsO family protein